MPRGTGVMTHNPFAFARGMSTGRNRVDAKFELRARLRNEVEGIDARIVSACRDQKSHLIESLTRARAEKVKELAGLD